MAGLRDCGPIVMAGPVGHRCGPRVTDGTGVTGWNALPAEACVPPPCGSLAAYDYPAEEPGESEDYEWSLRIFRSDRYVTVT